MRRKLVLHIYAATIIVAGAGLMAGVLGRGVDTDTFRSTAFLFLAVGVIAGEFVSILVPHRQEAVTVTVGDPFTLSLLFTAGLGPALIVKAVATLLDDVRRGREWWKALFNVGQFSLSLAAGSWLVTALGYSATTPDTPGAGDIAASVAAAFTYFIINMAIVTTAISLAVGESPIKSFKANLKTRVIQQGALLGFTPVVAVAVHETAALFPLLLIPIVVVYYSGRLTQRHVMLAQQLSELYETTRITNARISSRESIRQLLERVCNMFHANTASITLFARQGEESAVRTSLDLSIGSFTYMKPDDPDPTQGVWARAVSENRAVLIPHPIENQRLLDHFTSIGIKDVMVAPIHSEDEVNGVMDVANHLGEAQTFSVEDLNLFTTLANHASVALENARLIEQLEDSLVHLTEMNRLKDDFVASVSHELRTPLTSIRGYVRTLLRSDVTFEPQQQLEFLETIDRQSNRLHRLIEDLLAVSRIESETDLAVVSEVSMASLLDEVVAETHTRVKAGQIRMSFEEDLPTIKSDSGKVHQIVSNLIDNAIKYGGIDKPVSVRARKDGEGVTISVVDRGPGVPPDMADRIFDRFYQVDQSATRQVGGAGLGLYICRRIAEAIGGRVWLESSGPEGATFSLWLPKTLPDLDDTAPSAEPATSPAAWKI